jgi:catechol-2,3-dioxygenase
MPGQVAVRRLNHAVLYVRDLDRSAAFYTGVFGFDEIGRMGNQMAFFRAKGSTNHHDLGIASVGPNAPQPQRGSTGLYHLAWEVAEIEDLAAARKALIAANALVGESDHLTSKSLYGVDPDGNEFEVMWGVPEDEWPTDGQAGIRRLDIDAEIAKRAATTKT